MSTESATILFTDVVGSTELAQRLSPEAADEVRRAHFSVLRKAVAEAGGTEVKNLGDGLMVVFPSASAALACGVAMQQSVERDNRDREYSVSLRVGLSGGEVTREDNDYFGDPVIEAARLCAMCEGGQVLATDVVRGMAGRRSRHECRSLGELSVRGVPDPVPVVEVLWEPVGLADTTIPLPGRLTARPTVGVVGRRAEMEGINDVVKRVASGGGREILFISGEAGLGKSTLVSEAARVAHVHGACVLLGHCEEGLATPYQLFREAVGHYVTHVDEERLHAHIDTYGSELARLVPALSTRVPSLPPSKASDTDTERFLLFAAVVGLLDMASEIQPVVLVLDDLQWADRGSLVLLQHLAAADQASRLLILGTYRDNELAHADALRDTLGALRRLSGVSRIELTGLDDAGVVSFLEAAAGQSLDDSGVELAHAVYRETDGNPFFVGEVLRYLSETGTLHQDNKGRWTAGAPLEHVALPDSVREVIGGRVARLGKGAERVLSMAAVIGRDFDLDVLARAVETSEDELLDILESAAAVALVREPPDSSGRYSFAHALIQHTLYEDLGPNRRARAHRVVAEALEDLCGQRPANRVGELARHWTSATQPTDLAKSISYSRQAGDAALEALAPADALRYYAQALDLHGQTDDPDPTLALDLTIGLGTAQRQTGDPAFRDTLLNAARRAADLGDTGRLVSAALANDRGFQSTTGVIDTEKVEVLELALQRLSAHQPDRALILATLCGELSLGSALRDRQALAEEAIAIAESSGDEANIVRVLNHISVPLMVPPLLGQSLERTAEALDRARRVGDPGLLFFANGFRATVSTYVGDIDEMDRCIEAQRVEAERLNQPILNWVHAWMLGGRAQIDGDTQRSEQLAIDALQIGSDGGQSDAPLFFGVQVMMVSFQRGTMGGLVPLIEQMNAAAPDLGPGLPEGLLAHAHVDADHVDEARILLDKFATDDFHLSMDSLWLSGMVAYAEAAIQCADSKYAVPLLDRLAPYAGLIATAGGVTVEGPVSHYLGGLSAVVGRYNEADAYLAQSAAMCTKMRARFFAARTDLSWGKMLAERGSRADTEKARGLLTKARTVATANGYGNVERRAAAALKLLDG